MIKLYVKRVIVVLLAAGLVAAPVSGAVCGMACGDDAAACCCRSSADKGQLSYSAPSCCETEYDTPGPESTFSERAAGNSRTAQALAATSGPFLSEDAPAENGDRLLTVVAAPGNPRSSPLFILNASFLI